jgi:hypothetical protein
VVVIRNPRVDALARHGAGGMTTISGIDPQDLKYKVIPRLIGVAKGAQSEQDTARAKEAEARDKEQQLQDLVRELKSMKDAANAKAAQTLRDATTEIACTWRVCDVALLAGPYRARRDAVDLIQDTLDTVEWVRLPAARIQTLTSSVDARRSEYELISATGQLYYADNVNRLIDAGVLHDGNMITFSDETSTKLNVEAKQAAYQIELADRALNNERKRQETAAQQRTAFGLITRAEVCHAIPAQMASKAA